jgi:hypothetical protein
MTLVADYVRGTYALLSPTAMRRALGRDCTSMFTRYVTSKMMQT